MQIQTVFRWSFMFYEQNKQTLFDCGAFHWNFQFNYTNVHFICYQARTKTPTRENLYKYKNQ